MRGCVTSETGEVLWRFDNLPGGSNNIAELLAVLWALKVAARAGHEQVEIVTDSVNNLAWARGHRPGMKINDRPQVLAIQAEIAALEMDFTMTLVPRDRNLAGLVLERT